MTRSHKKLKSSTLSSTHTAGAHGVNPEAGWGPRPQAAHRTTRRQRPPLPPSLSHPRNGLRTAVLGIPKSYSLRNQSCSWTPRSTSVLCVLEIWVGATWQVSSAGNGHWGKKRDARFLKRLHTSKLTPRIPRHGLCAAPLHSSAAPA